MANLSFSFSLLSFVLSTQAHGQSSIDWQSVANKQAVSSDAVVSRTNSHRMFTTDFNTLNEELLSEKPFHDVLLPLPNGELALFRLQDSSVIAKELQERYPKIRTFSGYQVNKPENKGRFDVSPEGFHGMFTFDGDTVFVEPANFSDEQKYISYFKTNASLPSKQLMKQLPPKRHAIEQKITAMQRQERSASDKKLRTYRIAIAATGEYTQFHQGTKASGLAAIVTLVNRLNDLYQRDLGIKLELVANNDAIIYTDANSDPFDNSDADGEKNTSVINQAIGASNYDIGHVVNTAGGGLAGFGVVCDDNSKGDGVTGDSNPVGDAFYVDYVAHEVGHQFRAEHTFNGGESACQGNRADVSAYEPGSGSTVMSYAGICGEQSLQNNSDPYFHARSIEEIRAFITTGNGKSCGSITEVENNLPVVSAGNDYVIPSRTPFVIEGSATDADTSDQLTYSWEQYDLGPQSNRLSEQVDDGSRPLFRAWQPSVSPKRYLPRLVDVLEGKTVKGETYATTSRDLNFRLTVRDNKGGVSADDIKIQVVDSGESFKLTQPVGGETWNTKSQPITWQLAKTNESPINCSNVDIHLSTNNGDSFDYVLASEVANNGRAEVTIPNLSTTSARVKVSCSNNIFYSVNTAVFNIDIVDDANRLIITEQQSISLDEDTSLTLTKDMFSYNQEGAIAIEVLNGTNYTLDGNKLTPSENFSGQLTVQVKAKKDSNESQPFNAKVVVRPINDAPIAMDDSYSVKQNSAANGFSVLANDSDPDQGDTLTLVSVDNQGTGAVTIANDQLTYTPKTGFTGTESFTYTVKDSQNLTSTASVTVTVTSKSTAEPTSNKSGGGAFGLLMLGLLSLWRKSND